MGVIDPFVRTLTADEPVLDWFGFTIEEASNGAAVVTGIVSPEQVNGNGMTHGGVVFSIADQAFAMAANTLLPFAATVDAQIQFLAPTKGGDLLVATARTSFTDGRRAVIDVEVACAGRAIALFRGTARAIKQV